MTKLKQSILHFPIELDESHLNQLIKTHFRPIEISKQDRIISAYVSGNGKEIHLKLGLEGRISGMASVQFTPHIDNENKKVIIENLKAEIEKSGFISAGINWVLQSFIMGKIEELIQNQLDKQLQTMIKQYLKSQSRFPLPEQLAAELFLEDVILHKLYFENKILHLHVEGRGNIKLLSNSI